MMTPAWRTWTLLLAVSIGGGCDSSPVDPLLDLPSFRVGQRWVYAYEAAARDSSGVVLMEYRDSLEVRVVSANDEVFGIGGLVRMEARSLLPWSGPGPAPDVESVWYAATSRELVEHAYRNPSAVPVVIMTAGGVRRPIRFGGFFDPLAPFRGDIGSDSIQRREDPRRVLVAPLAKGMAWDSFRRPFVQKREVVDIESIRVLGEDVRAVRIRTTLPDFSPGLDWDDWVSSRGLMRRVIRVTAEGMDENLNPTGQIVNTETSTLVAIE